MEGGGREAAAFFFSPCGLRGKNPLAPRGGGAHHLGPMISSVNARAFALVVTTMAKRVRWHGSAWRRGISATHARHG
jgi:hypothetical protein